MKKTQKEIAADAAQGKYTHAINNKLDYHTEYLLSTGLYFEADRDDVRSRLSEAIWKGAAKYDETRCDFMTYVERILCNRRKNLIDKAARRRARTPQMLSLFHKEEGSDTPLVELVPDDNAERQIQLLELRDAFEYVFSKLTRRQTLLCKAIMKEWSIRRISRWIHISSKSLPDELEQIKAICIEAGIHEMGGAL